MNEKHICYICDGEYDDEDFCDKHDEELVMCKNCCDCPKAV